MKLQKLAGATSNIFQIFIADSSSSTGAGLTGLTNATGGLTAYYHRDTDTTATAISLVTMTVGSFTSSGFKEIDSTNMPGWYQFCPPNGALAAGAKSVAFHLKGATNMLPLPIEVQLTGTDIDNATTFGLTNLDAAITSRLAPTTAGRTLDVSSTGEAGLDFDNIKDATGAHTLTNITVPAVTSVTGSVGSVTGAVGSVTGAVGSVTAVVSANLTQILGTVLTETSGQIAAGFKKFFNIASPTSTMNEITLVDTVTAVTGLTASNLDTTVSSRLASGSYTAPPSAATIAQAVWDSLTSALTTVNSIGAYLLAKIDVVLSTRLASGSYTAPDNTTIGTINTKLGTPVSSVSADIASVKTDIDSIPTNPLLTTDVRLNHLDADVSTRTSTTHFDTIIGTPAVSVSADIAEIELETDGLASQASVDQIRRVVNVIQGIID